MGFDPKKANPGDVIESAEWNKVTDEVKRLSDELEKCVRYHDNGNVGIDADSPTHKLHIGTYQKSFRVKDTEIFDNEINRVASAGNKDLHIGHRNTNCVHITNYRAASDERLKRDVETIPDALTRVTRLRGVTFRWKDHADTTTQMGVVAQEVEEVFPEVVAEDDRGYKAVAYDKLVGALVEAIKEQQGQIDALLTEVDDLRVRLRSLESTRLAPVGSGL